MILLSWKLFRFFLIAGFIATCQYATFLFGAFCCFVFLSSLPPACLLSLLLLSVLFHNPSWLCSLLFRFPSHPISFSANQFSPFIPHLYLSTLFVLFPLFQSCLIPFFFFFFPFSCSATTALRVCCFICLLHMLKGRVES